MSQGFTEVFRWHAQARPNKVAISERGTATSFAALNRQIDSVCHALSKHGVVNGQLVGVALDDDAEHLVVLLALARMGVVLLPLDRRWSLGEKQTVVVRFKPDFTIVSRTDSERDDLWLTATPDWFAGSDQPYLDASVTMQSPLLLSLSSGTTGVPKGPRLTQEQFVARWQVYWIDMGMSSSDTFTVATPLYFGGGRAFAIALLWAGGTLDMFPPPYAPEALIAHVNETKATAIFLVPTLLRRLLAIAGDQLVFPHLKVLISSGSVLYGHEQEAVRARLTPNLYQYYSSTEAGGVSILTPPDFEGRSNSVGRPCFRVNIEIVDDDDRPLPRGTAGRLRYRSPASPDRYYLGDSSEAFKDGFFYPGDLGVIDEQGYLSLRGRSKDVIIRGGVNIYPADIEVVLQQIAGVEDVAVVPMASTDLGEEVAAFVVLSRSLSAEELTAECRARLAPFKVPRKFVFVDKLPRNGMGKVLKKELTARLETA